MERHTQVIYKYWVILYKGFEDPWILVPMRVLEQAPPNTEGRL